MILTSRCLSEIFSEITKDDESFWQAVDIARKNSSGKMWLIGGYLYKNLAHYLYGSKRSTKDFDLVVERANEDLVLSRGWHFTTNRFDNPKFSNGKLEFDFIPLEKIYYIVANGLEPSIENYFDGAPLNIHCFAYDIDERKVFGEVGVRALEERVVKVHNLNMLKYGAEKYNMTVNEMIKEKAEELGFKAEFVEE